MSDFFYTIGEGSFFPTFDTLEQAREYQQHVIKKDKGINFLHRDNVKGGYLIAKVYFDGQPVEWIR